MIASQAKKPAQPKLKITRLFFHLLLACSALIFANLAQSDNAGPDSDGAAGSSSEQQSPYYYYLNGSKRALWLRGDMVASFPQIPAAVSSGEYQRRIDAERTLLAAAAKFSDPIPDSENFGVVRLFAISDDIGEGLDKKFADGAKTYEDSPARQASDNRYNYSEVFSSMPGGFDYRALPGGVFVKFNASWDPARISGWLAEHGISFDHAEKILKNNLYLINCPGGLESLALANKFQETGEVLYSEPNWWRPAAR